MHGFQPAKHKAKPKNYANGGIVKGPGTGTSDDVEAMVPEDGYIMPADSTQALGFKPGMRQVNVSDGEMVLNGQQVEQAGGVQVLEAMRAATHMPVADGNMQQEPKFFFANGGPLDEEERRKAALNQIPGGGASPGWNGGTREKITGNEFTRNLSNTMNALAPVSGVAAPIVAGAMRGFAGGAKAAAASPVLEKVAAYGVPAAGFGALATAANNTPPATSAPAAMTPPVTRPVAARPVATGMPEAPGTPAAQSNAQAPAGNVNVRRQANGVMEFSGENVSGDVSYNGGNAAGFKPGGTGVSVVPSAPGTAGFQPPAEPAVPMASQNLTPADNGQGYGFGLLNTNRLAARNAMMDVQQLKPGSRTVLKSILQQQADAPGQQIERDKMGAEIAAGNANRALKSEELGAERGFRAGQLANDSARTALDAKRVGSELEVRGFEVGQAKRLENLRAKYESATDPKAKAELAQQLRTLMGKEDQANRFTVVPGGQEYDANAQVMRNVPARVLNNQTGQFVDGAGGAKALPALKDNSAAMAIVNDPSLSKDQRAAKLREMGYN